MICYTICDARSGALMTCMVCLYDMLHALASVRYCMIYGLGGRSRGGRERRGRERRREEEDRETFGGTDLGILREERHRSFPILFNALRKYPHCFERLAFSNLV